MNRQVFKSGANYVCVTWRVHQLAYTQTNMKSDTQNAMQIHYEMRLRVYNVYDIYM